MLDWYALHVKSNCERIVARGLEQAGIESYFPERLKRALFPGYVFGRFDYDLRRPVVRIHQVIHVLGDGRIPITTEEIASVRQIALAPPEISIEMQPFIGCGEPVIVTGGPLALRGLRGNVVFVRNQTRVIVSVELLHRSISAEVDAAWLEPISEGTLAA